MNNYETGGVPPFPQRLRDTQNKCQQCGKVWVGAPSNQCSGCVTGSLQDKVMGAMGYKTAETRPMCWNCAEKEVRLQENDSIKMFCSLSNAPTTRCAVCDYWKKHA